MKRTIKIDDSVCAYCACNRCDDADLAHCELCEDNDWEPLDRCNESCGAKS